MQISMLLNKITTVLSFSTEVWMSLLLGAVVTLIIAYIIYKIQKKESTLHKQDHDAKLEEIKQLHQQDSEKIKVLYELIIQSQRGSLGEVETAQLEQKIEDAAELINENDSDHAQALKAIAEKDKEEADLLLEKLSKYEHDLEELYNLHALNEHRHGNYNESAGWLKKLTELKPDVNDYRQRLFNDLNSSGHYLDAENIARETIAAIQTQPVTDSKLLVQWMYCLGAVNIKRDHFIEAEKQYNQALELGIAEYGPEHPEIYNIYNDLGLIWLQREDYTKAVEYLSIAQRIKTVVDDDDVVHKAYITFNLGTIMNKLGKSEECLKLYEEGKQLIFDRLGQDHPALTYYYMNTGSFHYTELKLDRAKELLQRCIEIFRMRNMTSNPEFTHPICTLGHVYFRLEEFAEAEKCYREALDVLEKYAPDNHFRLARVRQFLGENYLEWNKPEEAEAIFTRMIADLEHKPDIDKQFLEKACHQLADAQTRLGKSKEADLNFAKAEVLRTRFESANEISPADNKE